MAVAPESVRLVEDRGRPRRAGPTSSPASAGRAAGPDHAQPRRVARADGGRARRASPSCGCPGRSDLCFATTNRQAALQGDRRQCRRGGRHRLGQLLQHGRPREGGARASGCPRVVRVDGADELPDDLAGTVGVTAGASAPEQLVEAVIAAPRPAGRASRWCTVTTEDEYFPPPPELRELLRALATTLGLLIGRRQQPTAAGPGRRRPQRLGRRRARRRWPAERIDRVRRRMGECRAGGATAR